MSTTFYQSSGFCGYPLFFPASIFIPRGFKIITARSR